MATYHKQKNIRPKASESTENLVNKLDENASKAEQFLEKYKRPISYGILGAVILFLLAWAYHTWVAVPSESEATEELAFAQKSFEQDSLMLALNGDPSHLGLIKIADQYSSTPAGNIAKYYAGATYYKLGQYDQAIEYLKQYSGGDLITEATALGLIGDCYAQQEKAQDALSYYLKAANSSDNDFTTPYYLMKAGNISIYLKKYSDAAKYFQTIKDEYSESAQASQIEQHLEFAKGAAKNN